MKKTILLTLVLLIPAAALWPQAIFNLEEALQVAGQNSPQIRTARLSLKRSQELLNAQNAALKSQFSLTLNPFNFTKEQRFSSELNTWRSEETRTSSGVFNIVQPLKWTDGTLALRNQFNWRDSKIDYDETFPGLRDTRSKTYSNNLFVSYDQPLFTYNQTRLALLEVQWDLENSWLNYKIQELVLEQQVTEMFYSAFQQKMSLQVAQEELQNTQTSYDIIKKKFEAGLVAEEELLQAELNLANSKSQVQNNHVALENALDQFKQLIGIAIEDEIDLVAEVTLPEIDVDLQTAIDFGLKNRLELRQRGIDLNISRANLTRASATNEFKGTLSLSYGYIGSEEKFGDLYNSPTQNQRVQLSLDIPLFDWGEKESRIKAAEASLQSTQISLDEEKKNIIIGIRQAFRQYQNQLMQVELARKNIKIAQQTYDINLERYRNGDLTSMDLNLFQTQLSQKKNDLVNAIIAQKLAVLDLKVQSLWDFVKQQPVFEGLSGEDE